MWKMIVLLWLIPLGLGIVALARLGRGESVLRDAERQFLFGNNHDKELRLSIWLGLKLAALSILLFFAGAFHGLVIASFGSFWAVLMPFLTAICIILILALWLRSGLNTSSEAHVEPPRHDSRETGTAAHRLDGFEL
jgi:hypothetical protein